MPCFGWTRGRSCFYVAACLAVTGCASGASAPIPRARALPPQAPQLSEACASAQRLQREAHELLASGRWFAASRRLAAADRSCAATAASTADATRIRGTLTPAPGETSQSLLDKARAAALQGDTRSQQLLEDQAALLIEQAASRELTPRLPTAIGESTHYEWTPNSEWLVARSRDGIELRRRDEWYPRFQTTEHGARVRSDESTLSRDGHSLLALEAPNEDTSRERWVAIIDITPSATFGASRGRFAVTGYPPPVFSADSARLVLSEPTTPGFGHSVLTIVTAATGAVERRIEPPPGATEVTSLMLGEVGRYAVVRWSDNSLSVVELATGKAWRHAGKTAGLDEPFSPDERFAIFGDYAFGGSNHVVVYDTSAQRARPFSLGTCSITGEVVYDEKSQIAALGSFDGELCLIDLARGKLRKLPIKTPVGMALPKKFLHGAEGLLMGNRDGGILLDVTSGRQLATFPDMLGPLSVGGQPTVFSTHGALSIIDSHLDVRQVEPRPRPDTPVSMVTSIGPEVALLFGNAWLIAQGETGATRPFDFPPLAEHPPSESPDTAFLAFTAGPSPEIYQAASGRRAARSPLSFAPADPSTWTANALGQPPSTKTTCSDAQLRDPSGLTQLIRQDDKRYKQRDCASGHESAAFALPDYPTALLNPTRALFYDKAELIVWDLQHATAIGRVPWELNNAEVYALSPDDRYFFAGKVLWDLARAQRLLTLEYWPAKALFPSSHALLTSQGVTVDVWRAPHFGHAGSAYASRDGAARILFALDLNGTVTALETRGAPDAWDTTFGCGAGLLGVPFRVCRQALEQSGVFEALFE